MPTADQLLERMAGGAADPALIRLYGSRPERLQAARARSMALIRRLETTFPGTGDVALFSVPGRTEVGGNHTDHNAGRVLAAAVDLDDLAAARKTDDGVVRIASEGYPLIIVNLDHLDADPAERFTPQALVRGACARLDALGARVGGFDACVSGGVPKGSGLSSSAAFEVLVGAIENHLYNDGEIDPVTLAQAGQYAENHYFGKPCGLMDQTTCAVGGFVTIDFKDFARPIVKKVDFDFGASGYSLVIVDTGGNHAGLTEHYAAIEGEMKSVAQALGGTVLREFSKEQVLAKVPALRTRVSDRAILRALHFYDDDARVVEEVAALEEGRLADFLALVNASGRSSWMLNQNVYAPRDTAHQEIALALAVSEKLLGAHGACRVHGGGFAGTIQAFVPADLLLSYLAALQAIFGPDSCHTLAVRTDGAVRVAI